MKYLAIDHGEKRTGLAVCDANETIASPLTMIEGQGELVRKIAAVIEEERIEAVVIGLPMLLDDTEGPRAKAVRRFGEELARVISLPIHYYDERLSSFEAKGVLAGHGLTRKKKKKKIDAIAAATILRNFLVSKNL